MIQLRTGVESDVLRPLTVVSLIADRGRIEVRDGRSRVYHAETVDTDGAEVRFTVGGTLGWHVVSRRDSATGEVRDEQRFRVDAQTTIEDAGDRFGSLMRMLHRTLELQEETQRLWHGGRLYKCLTTWVRDSAHAAKGMRYYSPYLKDVVDLFASTQRADGMMWDGVFGIGERTPTYRGLLFAKDGFSRPIEDGEGELQRIPVENDVEYLYVELLHTVWQATGDDGWMAGKLDGAIRALEYSRRDPLRWSERFGLLKRGFTIDTWDFQPDEDAAITGHTMKIDADRTRFGVMHGDNTGYAHACDRLARMLRAADRGAEADRCETLAGEIRQRLDAVAWNGRFYRHHVPEDPQVPRDLGVDPEAQVSLSNAYALNRGVTSEQARAIIDTYQRIREQMPVNSPGEWYSIYPPFEKGFGRHQPLWGYVNGGVLGAVAGELARGAFEHGQEAYAVDVLDRMRAHGEQHDGEVPAVMKGCMPEPANRRFTPIELTGQVNRTWRGTTLDADDEASGPIDLRGVPTGRQAFNGLEFDVPSGGCIGLHAAEADAAEANIPVDATGRSIYVLHAISGLSDGDVAGWLTVEFEDGTTRKQWVFAGKHVLNWWYPRSPFSRKRMPRIEVAWEGANATCPRFGVTAWGFDQPHPEKRIARLRFTAADQGARWYVLGVSLCDAPHFMTPPDVSFGPVKWCTGALVAAMIEGLAGVVDTDRRFRTVRLSPRWAAAGVSDATATVRYPAGDGYIAYRWRHDPAAARLHLQLTGSGETVDLRLLLPLGVEPRAATVDGERIDFAVEQVGPSRYATMRLALRGVHRVTVDHASTADSSF